METKTDLSLEAEMLFENRIDYKTCPRRLDVAQNSVNELSQYIKAKEVLCDIFKNKHPNLGIDICCGTGLFSAHVLYSLNVNKMILIDKDRRFLNFTKNRLCSFSNVEFILKDALDFRYKEQADFVLLGSAYHHIHDNQKIEFLRNVDQNLKNDGYIIMNEHFIPPYNSQEEYSKVILMFYSKLIDYLKLMGTDSECIRIIKQVAYYGYNHDYEFKVSFDIFKEHLSKTNLNVVNKIRVWPEREEVFSNKNVGSFILVLKKNMDKKS